MFFARLLLIYLVLPAVLLLVSSRLPLAARFWFIFAIVPLGLILFAVVRYLADRAAEGAAGRGAARGEAPGEGAERSPEGRA